MSVSLYQFLNSVLLEKVTSIEIPHTLWTLEVHYYNMQTYNANSRVCIPLNT